MPMMASILQKKGKKEEQFSVDHDNDGEKEEKQEQLEEEQEQYNTIQYNTTLLILKKEIQLFAFDK